MRDALLYADRIREFSEQHAPHSNIFLCVPYTLLSIMAEKLKSTHITVASQNVHWLERGAATGEISPSMVRDTGATMVEIGHSERRAQYGETDERVNAKVMAALRNDLRPLVCIGDTLEDKEEGRATDKLAAQLRAAFHQVKPHQAERVLVAYEPVWAIGESGSPASPDLANRMHTHIKAVLAEIFGEQSAARIPVLYGGSVNRENAPQFVRQKPVDGIFIGRASWQADSFIAIISTIETYLHEQASTAS